MNHQPFETWLMTEDPLSPEERRSLQAHLAECPVCTSRQKAWESVAHQMRSAPLIRPTPGFTHRWATGLAQRRIVEQRRQTRQLLLVLSVGAGITFTLLLVRILLTTPISSFLVSVTRSITGAAEVFDTVQQFIVSLIQNPTLLPLWIFLASAVGMLSLVWFFAMWRIRSQGVYPK